MPACLPGFETSPKRDGSKTVPVALSVCVWLPRRLSTVNRPWKYLGFSTLHGSRTPDYSFVFVMLYIFFTDLSSKPLFSSKIIGLRNDTVSRTAKTCLDICTTADYTGHLLTVHMRRNSWTSSRRNVSSRWADFDSDVKLHLITQLSVFLQPEVNRIKKNAELKPFHCDDRQCPYLFPSVLGSQMV